MSVEAFNTLIADLSARTEEPSQEESEKIQKQIQALMDTEEVKEWLFEDQNYKSVFTRMRQFSWANEVSIRLLDAMEQLLDALHELVTTL